MPHLTENEWIDKFGYWAEHPDHTVAEWIRDVVSCEGDMRSGYWEWVANLEAEKAMEKSQ